MKDYLAFRKTVRVWLLTGLVVITLEAILIFSNRQWSGRENRLTLISAMVISIIYIVIPIICFIKLAKKKAVLKAQLPANGERVREIFHGYIRLRSLPDGGLPQEPLSPKIISELANITESLLANDEEMAQLKLHKSVVQDRSIEFIRTIRLMIFK